MRHFIKSFAETMKKINFNFRHIITQMYGRYTKDLSEYAKDEARRLKQLERQRKKDDRARNKVDMMIFSYLSSCEILSK